MGRTIVQEYGPIYGEAVNGTVMGRPNGSVYVPPSNTVSLEIPEDKRYFTYFDYLGLMLLSCESDGTGIMFPFYVMSANSQDLSSNIQGQVFSDPELTTMVACQDLPAGQFNILGNGVRNAVEGLEDGDKLYYRLQLMNGGVAIATSDTIEMTMVVVEP